MQPYRISEIARNYTEYDMIQKHTELPPFPEYRTRLLFAFLEKSSLKLKTSELFSLVSSLIQLGLDTHDLVHESENDISDEEGKVSRSQQLRVLAGDYFSSRFYHLLAQAGQIDVVHHLSESICEVNRLKTNLYIKMKQLRVTAEEYIQQSIHIKTELFVGFANVMEGAYSTLWSDILYGFTSCEVLLQEVKRVEVNDRNSWAFWHVLQNGNYEDRKIMQDQNADTGKIKSIFMKYNVKRVLYQMLEHQAVQVRKMIHQFDSEQWIEELYQIGEPFLRTPFPSKAVEKL